MISRVVCLSALLLPLFWVAAFCETPESPVLIIRSAPQRPIVEVRGSNEFLNFEMLVRNTSGLTLRISQIELSVYDSAHDLVLRKSINTDAFAPSIAAIGKQILAPGDTLDAFNPFSEFESSLPLTELRYSFCLLRESNQQQRENNHHRLPDDCDFREQFAVSPRVYEDKPRSFCRCRGRFSSGRGMIRLPITYVCRSVTPRCRRSASRQTRTISPATLFIWMLKAGNITTIRASWITGTVTASRSTRRVQELF
jgi:hypothetical protein